MYCCAAVRLLLDSGPDGGECPPVGDCRGFNGTCGLLPDQFATVAVLPDYPNGLQDWTCTAFPNDDSQIDSFIVGLISIAIAIPVTVFITTCFGIANDNEAPESWLEWSGWRKLVFGMNAHRRWHYTRGDPPVRYVKWYVRSAGAPVTETAANLWRSFYAWVTNSETPWAEEAIEAEQAADEEAAQQKLSRFSQGADDGHSRRFSQGGTPGAGRRMSASKSNGADAGRRMSESSVEPSDDFNTRALSEDGSAVELATYKHRVVAIGIAATAICWAMFTWFIFTYGMLIYRLLGEGAESSFSRSFGISYGMGAAQEWKDVAIEACKAAVILVILETLFLTPNPKWLEEHIDYLSLQALLLKQTGLGWTGQIKRLWHHTKRLSD